MVPLTDPTLISYFFRIFLLKDSHFKAFNNTASKCEHCLFCVIDVAIVIFIVKWIIIIIVIIIITNIVVITIII